MSLPDAAPPQWLRQQREHLFTTWSVQGSKSPPQIVAARGARFQREDGRWIWDLASQVFNVNVGHGHPHVQQRMMAQVSDVAAAAPNAYLPVRGELAGALAEVSGLHKAFLTTGGSEAVENAIKIAALVTGRRKVITRRRSYHGATLAVLGIAGDDRRAPFEALIGEGLHIDDSGPPEQPDDGSPSSWTASLQALVQREGPGEIAAILLEGLTGTNGMQAPPRDFWPEARRLCDAHGILLIDDEIFSGFGRTGRWFAFEHWGVRPDLMVIGKGLTSGYAPLAGVLANATVAQHFEDEKLWCGLTSYAHPVSCAAALGSIEVLRDEALPDNAARVGAHLRKRLEALGGPVREVRGLGLQLGLLLDGPFAERVPALEAEGLYALGRDALLCICPPLCLRETEADAIADALERALHSEP